MNAIASLLLFIHVVPAAGVAAAETPALPNCDRLYSDPSRADLAGKRALAVSLVDEGGKPLDGEVTVALAEGPGSAGRWRCTRATAGGSAAFERLPDRPLVVSAEAGIKRARAKPVKLGVAAASLTAAAPKGMTYLFDAQAKRCVDAGGREGRNAGRVGECGELSGAAPFDAPRDRLAGSAWTGVNLSGRDLTGADLERSVLKDVRLGRTRLNGASAVNAVVEGGELTRASLRGADLRGAKLAGAKATGADLSGADLRGTDLTGVDLRGAVLNKAVYDAATKLPFSPGKAYRLGMIFAGPEAPKIDEGASDASFRAFREALKAALDKKDTRLLSLRLTKTLRERCGPEACLDSVRAAVDGGGVFTDDDYHGFLAPAAALMNTGSGVWFSKNGAQWQIVEIGS